MESDSNSNSIKRKRVIKLVFIASFCIALLFVISRAARLCETISIYKSNNKSSSIMFSINIGNINNYDDPILKLYTNPKTKNEVLDFFSAITNSERVARAILDNAVAHNMRPSLAFAVAYVESRYNPRARSTNRTGTLNSGLFQLNSSVYGKISEKSIYDPYQNARLGIGHLQEYINLNGDEFSALAAYNAGITRISEKGIPGVTFRYISEVSIMEHKIMNFFIASIALSESMKL
ncbi:MAG: Transglycosylase SLT domain protein [Spirochaetes bacterium ADurb.Bin001]|jgi:hypothetical protein|nr:MAG: Transglycosylase SLT domain protein [Spirochaetes bacterium ADurb.Bin001]